MLPLFDVGVVVSFGRLIPDPLLRQLPLGAVNMHPSLLPRHRGPAPIHHTILSGDANAGISIIEVAPGDFDVGRVLLQQAVPLADGVHRCTLEDTLAAAGAQAILEVLRRLPEYRAASFSQESTGQAVSYAPKLTRAAGTIEWGTARKDELDALYRAAGDQIGVHTRVGGKRVRLDGLFTARRAASVASISPATSSRHRPGNAILVGDKKSPVLAIRCSDGWVGCTRLTVAGKKPSNAKAFFNGYRDPHLGYVLLGDADRDTGAT